MSPEESGGCLLQEISTAGTQLFLRKALGSREGRRRASRVALVKNVECLFVRFIN